MKLRRPNPIPDGNKTQRLIKLSLSAISPQAPPSGETLRRAYDSLRGVLNALPDLLFEVDHEGRIYDYRAPAPELLYSKPQEFLGRRFATLLPPDAARVILGAIGEAGRTGRHMGGVYSLPLQGGVHWFELSIAAKGDHRAPDARFIMLVRDITVRKQALGNLAASEEKYRRLHESMVDAFVSVDMQGRITESNPAYRAMLGYTEEELRRLTYTDLTPTKWHAFEADIVTKQILVQNHSTVYEKEYRHKDGTIFPVELRTFLLRDNAGKPVGMWAIVRDITLRKEMEQALRDSETRYRTLFDQSPDAVVIVDPETARLLDFNDEACKYLGYTRAELVQLSIYDLDVMESREEASLHIRKLVAEGRGQFTTRQRTKSGDIRDIEVISRVIQLGGRTLLHSIWRDITQSERDRMLLRKSRDELESRVAERTAQLRTLTAKMIDIETQERERIGYVLHEDIQQILVALQYKIATIQEDVPTDDGKRLASEAAGILEKAVAKVRLLSRQFLPPPLRGHDLIDDLNWIASDIKDSFGMAVGIQAASDLPVVPDPVRDFLTRGVRELLFNAVRHAAVKRAEVSVEGAEDGRIAVTVSDNGVGFETTSHRNQGLGLFKLRERTAYFGGEMRVNSAPGKGSRITLILPCR